MLVVMATAGAAASDGPAPALSAMHPAVTDREAIEVVVGPLNQPSQIRLLDPDRRLCAARTATASTGAAAWRFVPVGPMPTGTWEVQVVPLDPDYPANAVAVQVAPAWAGAPDLPAAAFRLSASPARLVAGSTGTVTITADPPQPLLIGARARDALSASAPLRPRALRRASRPSPAALPPRPEDWPRSRLEPAGSPPPSPVVRAAADVPIDDDSSWQQWLLRMADADGAWRWGRPSLTATGADPAGDLIVTALALQAIVDAAPSPSIVASTRVAKGTRWLLAQRDAQGGFSPDTAAHALATIAIGTLLDQRPDPALTAVHDAAIAELLRRQIADQGQLLGWAAQRADRRIDLITTVLACRAIGQRLGNQPERITALRGTVHLADRVWAASRKLSRDDASTAFPAAYDPDSGAIGGTAADGWALAFIAHMPRESTAAVIARRLLDDLRPAGDDGDLLATWAACAVMPLDDERAVASPAWLIAWRDRLDRAAIDGQPRAALGIAPAGLGPLAGHAGSVVATALGAAFWSIPPAFDCCRPRTRFAIAAVGAAHGPATMRLAPSAAGTLRITAVGADGRRAWLDLPVDGGP